MEYTDDDNRVYQWSIDDLVDKAFIKLDDGTTVFNVFTMGQNIAHDMWADGYFDEDDMVIHDYVIIDWIANEFKNVFNEIMREIKYQLINNPDINRGNISVE